MKLPKDLQDAIDAIVAHHKEGGEHTPVLEPLQTLKQYANVPRKEGFTQVCVTEGTEDDGTLEAKIFELMGVRIQYLECIITGPSRVKGEAVPMTGGRSDIFFAVHDDDIQKFTLARLEYGVRWVEDVLDNMEQSDQSYYPARVKAYRTW